MPIICPWACYCSCVWSVPLNFCNGWELILIIHETEIWVRYLFCCSASLEMRLRTCWEFLKRGHQYFVEHTQWLMEATKQWVGETRVVNVLMGYRLSAVPYNIEWYSVFQHVSTMDKCFVEQVCLLSSRMTCTLFTQHTGITICFLAKLEKLP